MRGAQRLRGQLHPEPRAAADRGPRLLRHLAAGSLNIEVAAEAAYGRRRGARLLRGHPEDLLRDGGLEMLLALPGLRPPEWAPEYEGEPRSPARI